MKKITLTALAFAACFTVQAQFGGIRIPKSKKEESSTKNSNSSNNNSATVKDGTETNAKNSGSSTPKIEEIKISSFHQQNKGKILFYSTKTSYSALATPITEYQMVKSKDCPPLSSWYLFDNAYVSAIATEKNITKLNINNLEFRFQFYLDGVMDSEKKGWTSKYVGFNSENQCALTEEHIKVSQGGFSSVAGERIVGTNWQGFISQSIERLTIGKHQLKIVAIPIYEGKEYDQYKAEGTLSLNVIQKLIDPNDPSVCFPAKSKSVALTKEQLAKVFSDANKIQPISCYLIDDDWNIERNNLTDVIIRRFINACFIYKDEKGKCQYTRQNIATDYVGGKYTGKLYLVGGEGHGSAPCDCLK